MGDSLKRIFKTWQIIGFIFVGIAGVILHFLYDWTNQSVIVATFSAVNESIWEHMKLLFFSMFIFSLIEYKYIGKKIKNFWCVKLAGTLIGLLMIPIIYYTYSGVFGVNIDWINILIYYVSSGTAYCLEYQFIDKQIGFIKFNLIYFIILCFIAVMFIVFTFIQPQIPLFKDMTTGNYGLKF